MAGKNMDMRPVLPIRFWVWRYFTGQHMDGYRRTNATFWYRGDRVLGGIVKATNWCYRPGYQRMLIRWAWFYGLIGFPVGLLLFPTVTKVVMWLGIIALIFVYGRKAYRAIADFQHNRKWLRPLHAALCGQIGVKRDYDPRKYIDLPKNFRSDPEVVIRIDLPDEFYGGDQQSTKALTHTIASKLGMPDAEVKANLKSDTPHLIVTRAPAPPDKVLYKDIKTVIEKAPDNAPFLGYGPRNKKVSVKLDDESPHVLVSAGSGGGKSVLLRLIAAQGLSKGGLVLVCDVKRVSHSWAKGLPRVTYCRDIGEIHDALVEMRKEGERRYRIIDDEGEESENIGPRIYVLLEEMNATITRLNTYWRNNRENSDPKASPAVDAIGDLLFMGRACRIHVIAVAQMATARSLGGPEARENFATRILARYTTNAWKMLVPEIWPAPRSSRHAGRVQVAIAGETTETQVALLSGDEARILALQGGGEVKETRPTLHVVHDNSIETPSVERKTLQQACESEWIPMNYEAARKARTRDDEFPKGVTGLDGYDRYTREELERWYVNRPRVSTGTIR